MQSWQLSLSATDGVLLFLHTMGFVSPGNQFLLDDLLDYYGKSATTEGIHQIERGKTRVCYTLCDAISLRFVIESREKRINSPADIHLAVNDQKGVRHYGAKQTEYELKYEQWSRKYQCNDLGSVVLCAEQIVRLMHILSELRDGYRDWLSYME